MYNKSKGLKLFSIENCAITTNNFIFLHDSIYSLPSGVYNGFVVNNRHQLSRYLCEVLTSFYHFSYINLSRCMYYTKTALSWQITTGRFSIFLCDFVALNSPENQVCYLTICQWTRWSCKSLQHDSLNASNNMSLLTYVSIKFKTFDSPFIFNTCHWPLY